MSEAQDLPVQLLLCINDTPENARWECTARALTSLGITAQLQRHPLWIVDNGSSCPNTAQFLRSWCGDQRRNGAQLRLFRLPENRYATYAFNRLLAQVPPEAYVVRLENDIEFHTPGWPQRLAGFLDRSGFGLASARPLDLPDPAPATPPGEWAGTRVQPVDEVPGYCAAIAPALRLRLGALVSTGCYIEDVLTSARARSLGYRLAYLAPDEIRCFHVDREPSAAYRAWKNRVVEQEVAPMRQAVAAYASGERTAHEPFAFDPQDGFHEAA